MRLTVDREANTLVVTPDSDQQSMRTVIADGTLDVGEGGVLLGVEVQVSEALGDLAGQFGGWDDAVDTDDTSAYLTLMPGDDSHARSTPIAVKIGLAASGQVTSLSVPRRGEGYEITYPSGNR